MKGVLCCVLHSEPWHATHGTGCLGRHRAIAWARRQLLSKQRHLRNIVSANVGQWVLLMQVGLRPLRKTLA